MENAFGAIIQNPVEVFVAVTMRFGVIHDHEMVSQLIVLRDIEPVQDALDVLASQHGIDVVQYVVDGCGLSA